MTKPTLAIDATNISAGGAVTHLMELCSQLTEIKHHFGEIYIFGPHQLESKLQLTPNINFVSHPWLSKNYLFRYLWLKFNFPKELKIRNVGLLFVPGGYYSGSFRPFVSMCRNMLVFDKNERNRYGFSLMNARLSLLNIFQSQTFRKAAGLIFISNYAKNIVNQSLKLKNSTIIHHGVSNRFSLPVKKQLSIEQYNFNQPFKFLYVSIIDVYKHQDNVLKTIAALREKSYPVEITFIGGKYIPCYQRFISVYKDLGAQTFAKYLGEVPYNDLIQYYKNADAFIFASSCENMPNTLLEAMSSGLPIACSISNPMPEFLGEHGYYFDPEQVENISTALEKLLLEPQQRMKNAQEAQLKAQDYNWKRCAQETMDYLWSIKANIE